MREGGALRGLGGGYTPFRQACLVSSAPYRHGSLRSSRVVFSAGAPNTGANSAGWAFSRLGCAAERRWCPGRWESGMAARRNGRAPATETPPELTIVAGSEHIRFKSTGMIAPGRRRSSFFASYQFFEGPMWGAPVYPTEYQPSARGVKQKQNAGSPVGGKLQFSLENGRS